jgi:hypothetical protein
MDGQAGGDNGRAIFRLVVLESSNGARANRRRTDWTAADLVASPPQAPAHDKTAAMPCARTARSAPAIASTTTACTEGG